MVQWHVIRALMLGGGVWAQDQLNAVLFPDSYTKKRCKWVEVWEWSYVEYVAQTILRQFALILSILHLGKAGCLGT